MDLRDALLVGGLEAIGLASLRPLLLLQFLLLAGFLVLCVAAGPRLDPNAANAVVAGMLGVAAMAVQNALVQISLKGAPSTAVMTSNVTRFTMDLGEMLLGRDPDEVAKARSRAKHTWPAIVGFTVGCGLGAACEAAVGLWSLALPAGLALLALALGVAAPPAGRRPRLAAPGFWHPGLSFTRMRPLARSRQASPNARSTPLPRRPPPAHPGRAWVGEGRSGPSPATASAEGRQFTGAPSPARGEGEEHPCKIYVPILSREAA